MTDYQREEIVVIERFKDRGYPAWVLKRAIERVKEVDRTSILGDTGHTSTNDDESNETRMILTYNGNSNQIRKAITRNWNILKSDPGIGNSIPERQSITYRRGHNLKDLLVHSDLTERESSRGIDLQGFFPCGHCKACGNSRMVKEYWNTSTNTMISINQFLTCNSTFIIYVLECPYKLRYVGSMTHIVKKRILEHMRAITNRDKQYPIHLQGN